MSDQPENNQILTQQPETIASVDADSEPAETPIEIVPVEDTLTADSELAETPTEIAVREDILGTTSEPETVPIAAEIPATIYDENYPTQLNQTTIAEPQKTGVWRVLAVFFSGMLVGSVLSLGSLVAWRMYQERVNLQIKLPSDVPLPESPSPVAAPPANGLPTIPPAPVTAQSPASLPSPNPTQIPSLSGVPQLASPSSSPFPAAETAVTERVSFESGATGVTLTNTLPDNKSKRYLLQCNSGQSMTVNVPEGAVSAAIIAPNGEKVATVNSTTPWQGQLSSSGDYTIEISGDNKANYGVKIEVK